ncbi:dioxygenase [Orrella marina]|uniref:Dioxygenase n=2 Tax=Orrella marina TaxID=2163011 RepID=A0A2R4XPD8_9BURK|nr:dioxygenase [Orrella marina]
MTNATSQPASAQQSQTLAQVRQPQQAHRQPVLFIPHGAGPCFFMDWEPAHMWDGMSQYLRNIAEQLPQRPTAIVMVSAHWMAPQFHVTSHANPDLVFDYYGFPPHTYELTYPAVGQPALAQHLVQLINGAGLAAEVDGDRGFDHGMFIPLKLMFPDADIPVVQLSLRNDLDPAAHVAVGQAIADLRDEGVLIVGSGMSFHNMRGYGDSRFTPLSEIFDDWLTEAVEADAETRNDHLTSWAKAPHAYACHPAGKEEHLIPLMVAAGAARSDVGRKVYSEQVLKTRLSGFQFG